MRLVTIPDGRGATHHINVDQIVNIHTVQGTVGTTIVLTNQIVTVVSNEQTVLQQLRKAQEVIFDTPGVSR